MPRVSCDELEAYRAAGRFDLLLRLCAQIYRRCAVELQKQCGAAGPPYEYDAQFWVDAADECCRSAAIWSRYQDQPDQAVTALRRAGLGLYADVLLGDWAELLVTRV